MINFPKPTFINGTINPDLSDTEINAGMEEIRQNNVAALWHAATDYETKYISGFARNIVWEGYKQGLPKCTACMEWVNTIWMERYYQRKPLVTHEYDPNLCDFSECGPMPYSVPELMAEIPW